MLRSKKTKNCASVRAQCVNALGKHACDKVSVYKATTSPRSDGHILLLVQVANLLVFTCVTRVSRCQLCFSSHLPCGPARASSTKMLRASQFCDSTPAVWLLLLSARIIPPIFHAIVPCFHCSRLVLLCIFLFASTSSSLSSEALCIFTKPALTSP